MSIKIALFKYAGTVQGLREALAKEMAKWRA
jgi:hypothetical protein